MGYISQTLVMFELNHQNSPAFASQKAQWRHVKRKEKVSLRAYEKTSIKE